MDVKGKVEEAIVRHRLLKPGDTIVTGVSGGPDSAALLHVLFRLAAEWRLTLIAAHVNHGFRPSESAEEAALVQAWTRELGIRCETAALDVPAHARINRLNPQDAARELRYRFFRETAARTGAGKLALAHHADDQAETVIHRLVRGSGTAGLAGMAFSRREGELELIRPLLRMDKETLLRYCEEQALPYRHDSSNFSGKYTRNRIRLEVMPILRELNPGVAAGIGDTADVLREEDAYLQQETERVFRLLVTRESGQCSFFRPRFLELPVALQRRLIKLILYYLSAEIGSIDFQKVEAAREALAKTAPPSLSLDLGGGVRLLRSYDRAALAVGAPDAHGGEAADYVRPLVVGGVDRLPEAGCSYQARLLDADESARLRISGNPHQAAFDADALEQPLLFRSRRPGDRMNLPGLNGPKKVKNIFIDEKIPVVEREKQPLLTDGQDRVLWIPGVRRSTHAPVTAATRRILHIAVGKTERSDRGQDIFRPLGS